MESTQAVKAAANLKMLILLVMEHSMPATAATSIAGVQVRQVRCETRRGTLSEVTQMLDAQTEVHHHAEITLYICQIRLSLRHHCVAIAMRQN